MLSFLPGFAACLCLTIAAATAAQGGAGIDAEREEYLEMKVAEHESWRSRIYDQIFTTFKPPPPCLRLWGIEADRGAPGHPYSASSHEACELRCRQHLRECYAGWFDGSGGLVLTSIPPQFYCHCCMLANCTRTFRVKN